MNLSLRWLSDYVDLKNLSPKAFADGMTMSGSKVEGWHNNQIEIENVVVGNHIPFLPIPTPVPLTICKVDAGKEKAYR
jgi:phenylalanyl-tRNA synthetase beta chain